MPVSCGLAPGPGRLVPDPDRVPGCLNATTPPADSSGCISSLFGLTLLAELVLSCLYYFGAGIPFWLLPAVGTLASVLLLLAATIEWKYDGDKPTERTPSSPKD
jgi:hypothetical protein